MSFPATFVDPVETVKAWINAQTALVGPGTRLPLGAHKWGERSPRVGAYAWLVHAGGGPAEGDAVFMGQYRVSATVYAGTDVAARLGALAYAEVLAAFEYAGPATVALPDGTTATVMAVDNITGPTALATGEDAYLVDAVFYLRPN